MLSKSFEIWSISKEELPHCLGIKIKPISLLSSEIHPKHQKKGVKSIYAKNRTSDFKNISDYDYVGLKHSNVIIPAPYASY